MISDMGRELWTREPSANGHGVLEGKMEEFLALFGPPLAGLVQWANTLFVQRPDLDDTRELLAHLQAAQRDLERLHNSLWATRFEHEMRHDPE